MADVTINYKGSSIATMDASGTKTLLTEGQYCEDDIEVAYVKPGGGSAVLGTKSIIANGTYDAEDDDLDGYSEVTVSVSAPPSLKDFLQNTLLTYFDDTTTTLFTRAFQGNTSLKTIVMAALSQQFNNSGFYFSGISALEKLDLGPGMSRIATYTFTSCAALGIIILRKSDGIVTLNGTTNIFNGTPFASSPGGTIYIPKSLYDHLDDGTSLDYKANSNWATVLQSNYVTWAKIEGSAYENYYADGTPIPSA